MPASSSPRVAIVGAGMAGLACARELRRRGLVAQVLEKSRGLGGRLATRRTEGGDRFDHGAQFVTARDPGFAVELEAWAGAGAVRRWSPRLPPLADAPPHSWWIGEDGMKRLVEPLAAGVDIRLQATVVGLSRHDGRWRLALDEGGCVDGFDAVAITAPAPQTRGLLERAGSPLAGSLDAVAIAPCWALMLAFSAPWELPFEAARQDHGPVAWLARQASRFGGDDGIDRWVVHASPAWSQEHLERTSDEVVSWLLTALAAQLPAPPSPVFARAHRWRYAMTIQPLGRPFLADPADGLWAGGDWCLGARVENAFQSGIAVAGSIADALGA
ncbi:MAG TPA: FAD-dependent oxidoreductase [Dyella sp.]|nr:FAD-dependent oxidoreductase [Dyella sp.]